VTLGTAFYVLMLLCLVGYGWFNRAKPAEAWPGLVVWLLLLCLGWAVFGSPIS
jgi:hypothetical protein